jgi:hypothetical protein
MAQEQSSEDLMLELRARMNYATVNAEASAAIAAAPEDPRKALEAKYGQVWTTDELSEDFTVLGFSLGICVATRKSDGQKGSLEFKHSPRFYFNFVPHRP